MDDKLVKEFLWKQKEWLLSREKVATGNARYAITGQLQAVDTFFRFLASKQTEEDMEILKLSLDEQATPIDDIPSRARKSQMRESILAFIKTIPPGLKKPINAPGISKRTVTTTFHALGEEGIIDRDEFQLVTRNNQKDVWITHVKKQVTDQKGK